MGGTGLGMHQGRKGSQGGPRWLGTPTCTCLLQGTQGSGDAPSCELLQHRILTRDPSYLLPRLELAFPSLIFLFLISAFHFFTYGTF